MAKSIVVTQPMEFTAGHKDRLGQLGHVTYYDNLAADSDAWLERCKGADIICTGKFGFREKWAELHDVFVSVPFVGTGFLDPALLEKNNVVVSRGPGCNRHAVSEWIIGMMIMISRRLNEFTNVPKLPAGQPPQPTHGLAFKNVTVLGKGGVGKRVGAICAALEMNVTYFKRHDDLTQAIANADIVVNTLSLNPTTVGLLDKGFFAALKPSAAFITVTSDEIVDIDAMFQALDNDKLAYVANDAGGILMGDTTDPSYQKLLSHPKVFVTPHISYNTDVTHQISNDMMIENVEAWLKGEPINVLERTQ